MLGFLAVALPWQPAHHYLTVTTPSDWSKVLQTPATPPTQHWWTVSWRLQPDRCSLSGEVAAAPCRHFITTHSEAGPGRQTLTHYHPVLSHGQRLQPRRRDYALLVKPTEQACTSPFIVASGGPRWQTTTPLTQYWWGPPGLQPRRCSSEGVAHAGSPGLTDDNASDWFRRGKPLATFTHPALVRSCAFSPSALLLAEVAHARQPVHHHLQHQ